MNFPLFFAHGQEALYFFASMAGLFVIAVVIALVGAVYRSQKSERARIIGKRLLWSGGAVIMATGIIVVFLLA